MWSTAPFHGLRVASMFLLASIVFDAVPAPVSADTRLHAVSDSLDWLGQGLTYELTPETGTFVVDRDQRQSVRVRYVDGTQTWTLEFAGPADTRIARGFYPLATRWPFHVDAEAGLSVSVASRGCNTATGAFYVKQADFDGAGNVTALRVVFEHHCEGARAALRGDLRWNAPVAVDVQAPLLATARLGEPFTLAVTATDTAIVPTMQAIDLPPGATFATVAPGRGRVSWNPTAGQLGVSTVRFVATGSGGARDTIATQITVLGEMSLRVEGESDDGIANGVRTTFRPADGTFSCLTGYQQSAMFLFAPSGSFGNSWELDLRGPNGGPLQPGAYVAPYPSDIYSGTDPALRFSHGSNYCNGGLGEFRVRDVRYAGGAITALRATFEYHCAGRDAASSGEVRWNVALPVALEAPLTKRVTRGEAVALSIAARALDGSPLTLFSDGPPAGSSFVDHGDGTASFSWTVGANDPLGTTVLRFRARSANGDADTAWTKLRIVGGDRFRVESPEGDWIGAGETRDYSGPAVTITPSFPYAGFQFEVRPTDLGQRSFTLQFRAANGESLRAGRHYDPTMNDYYDVPTAGRAAMQISSGGRGCSSTPGKLWVKEIVQGASGIDVFRAAFEQRCDGGPPLRGEIRYRPRGAVLLAAPFTRTAQAGFATTFDVAAELQGAAVGATPTFSLANPAAGVTLAPLGGNAARVSWTPQPGQIGENHVLVVAQTPAGSDTSDTAVSVTGETSLALYSPPNEPIGGGTSRYFTIGDGTFQAAQWQTGVNASFRENGQSSSWSVLAMPAQGSLATGFYTNTRGSSGSTDQHILRVISPSNALSCQLEAGWFQVRQYDLEPNGDVRSLWLRFYERCLGSRPGLVGELRFNVSVSVTIDAPTEIEARPGRLVSVGVKGTARSPGVTTLWMTGAPVGASFADQGDDTGLMLWTPTGAQFGTHRVVFHARDAQGHEDSTLTEVRVLGLNAFRYRSDKDTDPVGLGRSRSYGPDDGTYAMNTAYPNFLVFQFDTVGTPYYTDVYSISFAPPTSGAALTRGTYLDAPINPSSARPGFMAQLEYRSCNFYSSTPSADFRVRRLERSQDGQVSVFAADFESRCSDTSAVLHGSTEYQVPNATRVDAPIRVIAELGETARFRVTGHGPGGPVALSAIGPPGAVLTPVAPDTADFAWAASGQDLGRTSVWFVARAADGSGSDTVETIVEVHGLTSLELRSAEGDPIGGGDTTKIVRADGDWSLRRNAQNGVSVEFTRPDGQRWQLDFAAPNRALLAPGSYPLAGRYPLQEPTRPGLSISTDRAGCNTILGGFVVRHLDWGDAGEVNSFWVTFDQRCNGGLAGLTGELRWNLDYAVPVQVSLVAASAGPDGVSLEWRMASGEPVTLERRAIDGVWQGTAMLVPDGLGAVRYLDRDVTPGERYGYRLALGAGAGRGWSPEVWVDTAPAIAFGVDPVRPNPGRGAFTLPLSLTRDTPVRVDVIDVTGRLAWTRPEARFAAGRHSIPVDPGGSLPPGVYLVRVQAGDQRRWQRISVVR